MSRLISTIRLFEDFISLLFPRVCQSCGDHLVRNEMIICTSCLVAIPRTDFHSRRENELEKSFWGRCHIEKAAAFAYFQSGGIMQALIHRLKYDGITEVGMHLGSIYGTILRESGFTKDIDCIIPVPLHRSKERKRGFNQSLIIAQGISGSAGIEVADGQLTRIVRTDSQTSRSRYKRWENIMGVFRLKNPELLRNRNILLIDDVITTGSTIEGCVHELNSSEGVRVSVAALATALL